MNCILESQTRLSGLYFLMLVGERRLWNGLRAREESVHMFMGRDCKSIVTEKADHIYTGPGEMG